MKMSTRLSVTVQHALRALSVLAGLPEGASLPGRELAKRAGIPANYLSKILWTLGGAGFIGATREAAAATVCSGRHTRSGLRRSSRRSDITAPHKDVFWTTIEDVCRPRSVRRITHGTNWTPR